MGKSGTFLLVAAALAVALPAPAQTTPFAWDNATEFSYVATAGNSSSNTLGFKSTLGGTGSRSTFKFEVGGIRAASNFTTRTAVGTPTSFQVRDSTYTVESAANYFARSRHDRTVGGAFAFAGAGWERNTFSGVNHRFSFVAGMGKVWIDTESGLFKTDLGGTYTIQKDVEPDPTASGGFGGARATIEGTRALTTTTDLSTVLVADENLHDSDDLRLDWVTSIAVDLTDGLAFKTSYQMLFDNDPALSAIDILDATGVLTGEVRHPSQKVDSFLTLSLVIKL